MVGSSCGRCCGAEAPCRLTAAGPVAGHGLQGKACTKVLQLDAREPYKGKRFYSCLMDDSGLHAKMSYVISEYRVNNILDDFSLNKCNSKSLTHYPELKEIKGARGVGFIKIYYLLNKFYEV